MAGHLPNGRRGRHRQQWHGQRQQQQRRCGQQRSQRQPKGAELIVGRCGRAWIGRQHGTAAKGDGHAAVSCRHRHPAGRQQQAQRQRCHANGDKNQTGRAAVHGRSMPAALQLGNSAITLISCPPAPRLSHPPWRLPDRHGRRSGGRRHPTGAPAHRPRLPRAD